MITEKMNALAKEIDALVPEGWMWFLFNSHRPRATLVNPEFNMHFGQDGETIGDALEKVVAEANHAIALNQK